ncbi:hypothetical protein [Vibrio metschnikovii]|uniref:hypothetical protein n=1 Tax=Vibrio metschnikovii TaxID=28172 RepID=UPI001C30F7BA|nr:hypothetical protein [Vibrio metschnikovii]
MKIIASMIESAQWQAWLSQQNSPYPIVTNSKKPCTNEVTIVAAPCSLAEIDSDLLDYDELVIHIWGLQATLANALRNGAEEAQIDSVVAKWVEMSEQLLAWLPKHQHKVNVLSHAHATYFTQDWCEWLNNLGIEWPQTDINTTCARTSQDEYDLFAAYYVKIHPQLERLEQLLLSVALPMGEDYPQLPLSIAELTRQSQHAIRRQRYTDKQLTERETEVEQLRQEKAAEQIQFEQQLAEQTQQLKAAQQQQQTFVQENELVITELHRVQEALETALQQHQQQTNKYSTLEQQLSASREQQNKLEQSLTELQGQHIRVNDQYTTSQTALKASEQQQHALAQENELVITELHRVQEALETALQQHQQQTDTCSTLEQQLSASDAQQAKLEQSLTELQGQHTHLNEQYTTSQAALKVSEQNNQQNLEQQAKLERQVAELTQQKSTLEQQVSDTTQQKKALEQENSMIIAELHRVQEALETLYYEKSTLQQQIDQQVQQLKAHSVKISSLIKRQRLTKLELAQALASKTLLEKELTAHHASTLWKMTVPVRKFRQTPQRKRAAQLAQQKLLIEFSEYFDKDWYLAQYPDVIEDGLDPIEHYLRFGAQEGRNPSAEFNTLWYLKTYSDVAESGLNPLVHFIQYGEREERQTSAKLLELKSV